MIGFEERGYHMGNCGAVPFLYNGVAVDKLDMCALYLPAVCDIHLGNAHLNGCVLDKDNAVLGNGG